jgi:hypothetical protein
VLSVEAGVTTGNAFRDSNVRHGTYSGYSKHQSLRERPCDPCYFAKQAYDFRWRSAPDRVRKSRIEAMAQTRALKRLSSAHRDEYVAYYRQELDAAWAMHEATS